MSDENKVDGLSSNDLIVQTDEMIRMLLFAKRIHKELYSPDGSQTMMRKKSPLHNPKNNPWYLIYVPFLTNNNRARKKNACFMVLSLADLIHIFFCIVVNWVLRVCVFFFILCCEIFEKNLA